MDRVLGARGLADPARAEAFLEPALRQLHDPALIPDLERAADRLLAAASAGEPIVIYGDYDADGTTAAAILYHMLHTVAPDAPLSTYVPHRLDEGYGINTAAVRQLAADGARVIVSVDCGITAIEPALVARDLGVDLIITDHHNPPASMDDLPQAYAVVHPRRPDSRYPFGDLCGAGVAYKLAWRLATGFCQSERVTPDLRTLLVELLALAALGTVADVVPLVGENRIITRFGLGRLKHSPIAGIGALVEASGLAGASIDAEDVGFRLAPRINAAGRLGHARDTLELLTTATGARAAEIARALTTLNDQRRRMEKTIVEQAEQLAENSGMTGPHARSIVLANEDWHRGIVGIACSRLVDRFARPTILLQRQGALCKGSGRSIDALNLHAALDECSDLLESFGGHDMAAGLTVRSDRLDEFAKRFESIAREQLEPSDLVQSAAYDCDASLEELTTENLEHLGRLRPFGRGNPPVCVVVRAVRLDRTPSAFGATGAHLSLHLGREVGGPMRVVGWNWARHREGLRAGMEIDVLIEPRLSSWQGRTRVEPVLVDLRVCP